jgi:phosphoglycolate phosphatase-like HAD superfamily hydrolase
VHDTLLVLDFDGVICDSVDECFVASWEARFRLRGGTGPVPAPPAGRGAAFAHLRPFVRNGEDFLVILEAAERGAAPADQAGFDSLAAALPRGELADFKRRFYEARERMLAEERERWLGLNRVYPHSRAALLAAVAADLPLRVLSTKRRPYILEILAANGVRLPAADVHHTTEHKAPLVSALLDAAGLERAVFVDDQVDFLRGLEDPRVEGYLAAWGYVRPEWLTPAARALDPAGFLALVERLGGRPAPGPGAPA